MFFEKTFSYKKKAIFAVFLLLSLSDSALKVCQGLGGVGEWHAMYVLFKMRV